MYLKLIVFSKIFLILVSALVLVTILLFCLEWGAAVTAPEVLPDLGAFIDISGDG